jgi:phosphoribosylglycinamide formyltransferase-1
VIFKNTYKNPKLLIFANGTKDGGGSGFSALVDAQKHCKLRAEIVGVVSSHLGGGVEKVASKYGIPFYYYSRPGDELQIRNVTCAEYIALSGWLWKMTGDPKTVFNIHPSRLIFGGKGMYGINVHRAAIDAFNKGVIKNTAVTMHFATEEYDKGPVFFEYPVPIYHCDTPETLQERVKWYEHIFQWAITDLVAHKQISWDGKDPGSLIVPKGYQFLPKKV